MSSSSNHTNPSPTASSDPTLQSDLSSDPEDPFNLLLTLEDTLYTTAYTSGVTAGSLAGRIEGRVFGLEKGFEKFAALGQLHGRSVVWGARILSTTSSNPPTPFTGSTSNDTPSLNVQQSIQEKKTLPTLPPSTRLTNNTTLLHSLTDPLTFSTDNTEDAVADFDDRVKRAGAKAKVIERIVGETETNASAKSPDGSPVRRVVGNKKGGNGKKGDDSMEDFVGSSRLLR